MKALVLAIGLAGCTPVPALRAVETSNPAYKGAVYLLFEHDGCAVYRFYDEGRSHYYAVCAGQVSTHSAWDEEHNKTRQEFREDIQTGRAP